MPKLKDNQVLSQTLIQRCFDIPWVTNLVANLKQQIIKVNSLILSNKAYLFYEKQIGDPA